MILPPKLQSNLSNTSSKGMTGIPSEGGKKKKSQISMSDKNQISVLGKLLIFSSLNILTCKVRITKQIVHRDILKINRYTT